MNKNLTGKQFNRLTIIKEIEPKKVGKGNRKTRMVLCRCICGGEISVMLEHLRSGNTKSCGCLKREIAIKTINKVNTSGIIKGKNNYNYTHGMSKTRIYDIYYGMHKRCNNLKNKTYANYGERGIKLLWKNFDEFYNDMYKSYVKHCKKYGKKDTSIDRINNNGHYCKKNCRWATREEQANNTRCNVLINNKTIAQWAQKIGISRGAITGRRRRGDTIKQALSIFDQKTKKLIALGKNKNIISAVQEGKREYPEIYRKADGWIKDWKILNNLEMPKTQNAIEYLMYNKYTSLKLKEKISLHNLH